MATQAAMSRQPYPPMSSYPGPQSNSPSSIHSPQTDAHGRPVYSMPAMQQQMYYPPYQPQQSPYSQHGSSSQHSSMTSAPTMINPYQQAQQHMHPQQQQHQQPHQHPQQHQQPSQRQSNMIDTKPQQQQQPQRPPSVIAPPQDTPGTPTAPGMPGAPDSSSGSNPSAAPGPIPATTPLVVRQDNTGVQWIAFEYSRDRVKMEYTIRCDVESVVVEDLSQEFRSANCVYPRACCGKDQYKGNRLAYESECNAVGWALAQLNPPLREKRGLIQRAVDSWRNSNQDPRLRSRRVRRQAKVNNRKAVAGTPGAMPGPQAPPSAGLGNAQAENDYSSAPAHHHQQPNGHQGDVAPPSPTTPRYAQNFYPAYPQHPSLASASAPSVHDAMEPMRPPQASALSNTDAAKDDLDSQRTLFGDVPEAKRRKFILLEDQQRGGTRVRIRVMLDHVKMDDMPDSHLRTNAVFPRSYYPRQVGLSAGSPRSQMGWDDEDDEDEGASRTLPTRGKTSVTVALMDGSEAKLPVPRMTKSRRNKELALNEMGYRMSWGQARTFDRRTLFLQRSLDAYRNKMKSTMVAAGQDVEGRAPHFETRAGKRRWQDYKKRSRRGETP